MNIHILMNEVIDPVDSVMFDAMYPRQ